MLTETLNGCTIKIEQDDDPESPRSWDNLGTMACFHRRYSVPNETGLDSADYGSWDELKAAIVKQYDPAVILPVYAYDHSVLDISTRIEPYWWHAAWDAGQLGFIFVSKEKARREHGWKVLTRERRAQLAEQLHAEVKTYSQWVNGDVYGYIIEDENGGEVDACWGFYGCDEALQAAREAAAATGE